MTDSTNIFKVSLEKAKRHMGYKTIIATSIIVALGAAAVLSTPNRSNLERFIGTDSLPTGYTIAKSLNEVDESNKDGSVFDDGYKIAKPYGENYLTMQRSNVGSIDNCIIGLIDITGAYDAFLDLGCNGSIESIGSVYKGENVLVPIQSVVPNLNQKEIDLHYHALLRFMGVLIYNGINPKPELSPGEKLANHQAF
jgi:hypothetical protein